MFENVCYSYTNNPDNKLAQMYSISMHVKIIYLYSVVVSQLASYSTVVISCDHLSIR